MPANVPCIDKAALGIVDATPFSVTRIKNDMVENSAITMTENYPDDAC